MIYYHPNSWCNGRWCKWRKWCGEKGYGMSSIGVHSPIPTTSTRSKRNKSSSIGSKNSRNLMSAYSMLYISIMGLVQCWGRIGVVESKSYWRCNVNVTYNHLCTDPICYFWVCVSVKIGTIAGNVVQYFSFWLRSTFLPRNDSWASRALLHV